MGIKLKDKNGNLLSLGGISNTQIKNKVQNMLDNGEFDSKIQSLVPSVSTGGIGVNYFCTTELIGNINSEIIDGYDFRGWCPTAIQYSKKENKFICMQYMSMGHLDSKPNGTSRLFKIDADTYIPTESKPLTVYENDGTTPVTVDIHPSTLFTILDDNTYLYYFYDDSDSENIRYHRIVSDDNGVTWKITNTYNGQLTEHCRGWGIYKGHNGRLLTGCDGYANNGTTMYIAYSDDNGVTWNDKLISVPHFINPPDEPCIIAIPNTTKLLAIVRYSVYGNGRSGSDETTPEPACYTISEDNGETWSELKVSTTLTNMNASDCCAYIEDGIIHLFVASRYYPYLDLYTEKQCIGQIWQYYATIEDALNDKWTFVNEVVNSQGGYGSTQLTATDFGAPGIAYNPNSGDALMIYFDLPKGSTDIYKNAVHRLVRISSKGLKYTPINSDESLVFPSKSDFIFKYLINQLEKRDEKIAKLQYALSQIEGSGINAPTGQVLYTFEWLSSSNTKLYNTENSPINGNMYLYNNYKSTGEASVGELMKTFTTLHPTKANYAIDIVCNIQTWDFAIGIIDTNNKFHGLSSYSATTIANNSKGNDTFSVTRTDFYGEHEIEVIYNNGEYKLKIDGTEYSCDGWDNTYALGKLDAYYLPSSTGIGNGTSDTTITTPNKSTPFIVIAYETDVLKVTSFKYGEWDS